MKKITLLIIISLLINGMFGDEVLVMEGDSVTLHTNDADIQAADDVTVIWTYKKTRIARINRKANKAPIYDADVLVGRFKDRLKMDDQTGDLTITNIRATDSGLYEAEITVGSKNIPKSYDVKGVSNPESDQQKSVSVKDADSVTLHTDVPDIKKYDVIQWKFKGVPIAQFNGSASKISEDVRFRDKLQLDVQTGSLKIKNIRMSLDLSGLYEVDLTSSSYTIHQSFTVTVSGEVKSVSVMKGDPVTINIDVPDIKTYDRILLIFGCDDRIAEANKQNKKFTLNGEVRDRLKLNDQTGDLTITDITTEDAGLYELKMSSRRRTIQRRFSVSVSERGLSPGAIAGISVFFILLAAAAAAAGVIYYRRKIAKEEEQWERKEEKEMYQGEFVYLYTNLLDIKRVEKIEWIFGETLIAIINLAKNIFSTYDGGDGEFKDKLKLNDQTGDLNINDLRREHTGVYKLKIIRDGETSEKRFILSVRDVREELKVYEGELFNLKTEVKDIKRDDVIEWTFRETLIAKINPANNIFSTSNDDLFRGKLNLNPQTGDLNVKNIRLEHTGDYKLKIIRDGQTLYRRFRVFVRGTIKELLVDEGKSVDLETEVKDIKRVEKIEWRFGETLIAEINPSNNIFSTYNDNLFRDKLKLNDQTGDLKINDIREKHDGFYKLKIITDGEISERRFIVFVRCNKEELLEMVGYPVDLKTDLTEIKRGDVIEWRFGETLIAEINPANKIFSTYDGDDDIFRDKLELNRQTGDLNINDIREKHDGVYTLKIIRDRETSYKTIRVSVRASRGGDPVKRGGDSGETEMQTLLPNSSHNSSDPYQV